MGARYVVKGATEAPVIVEILADRGATATVRIEQAGQPPREVELSLTALADGGFLRGRGAGHSRVDAIRRAPGQWAVLDGVGATLELEVQNERDSWLSGGEEGGGVGRITVAMPGKVVAVDAVEGATVQKGQRLLVIEAMKMENDVKSPRDGVVRAVLCKVGDAVEGGAVLVEIE